MAVMAAAPPSMAASATGRMLVTLGVSLAKTGPGKFSALHRTAALTVSGLPTDSFLYLGYLPHRTSERHGRLEEVESQPYTLVILESPYRIVEALEDILLILGERRICVAREMTKMFEEYWRGTVREALEYFKDQPARGEFTLVVQGKPENERDLWTETELLAAIERELKGEKSAKEISTELAEQSGWNKKDIYRLINRKA